MYNGAFGHSSCSSFIYISIFAHMLYVYKICASMDSFYRAKWRDKKNRFRPLTRQNLISLVIIANRREEIQ